MIEREVVAADTSPMGQTIEEARRRRAATDSVYRHEYDALAVTRHIARQVLEYRLDHGLTQQQLANLTGTSLPQISRIESGVHNPTLKTLQRLAAVMGKQLAVSFVDPAVEEAINPTVATPQ
jgi:DNA-binding XRE family transcriptional regulator